MSIIKTSVIEAGDHPLLQGLLKMPSRKGYLQASQTDEDNWPIYFVDESTDDPVLVASKLQKAQAVDRLLLFEQVPLIKAGMDIRALQKREGQPEHVTTVYFNDVKMGAYIQTVMTTKLLSLHSTEEGLNDLPPPRDELTAQLMGAALNPGLTHVVAIQQETEGKWQLLGLRDNASEMLGETNLKTATSFLSMIENCRPNLHDIYVAHCHFSQFHQAREQMTKPRYNMMKLKEMPGLRPEDLAQL